MEKICVAVRVRPPVNEETSSGSYWKVEDNRISLHRSLGTPVSGVSFTFDHVFDQDSSNGMVYEFLTKDIIHAAVEGFNGTAFAYGQTSSGKTYTMNGSDNDPGIVHRAVKDIFRNIEMITDREFLIRVSYMEIYNEDINDLFAVENQKLQIHESLERGVFVAGLREEIVNSVEQVLKLIQLGEVNRHFGETNMNVRSSRSHSIFRMVIESKGKDTNAGESDDAIRVSVLNLVDLAGSERIAKTGAGGVRLKEGKHINKSLMVLGNVINKLSDGAKRRGHIPYRDSKLTRILQPALGGNAKTSIICTLAPEELHIEETKGTLQFASRAKRITNCVQVNEILTDAALLKRQKLEIEELRKKLQGSHAEVLEQEVFKLRNDMLKYELEREKLAMELEEERKSHRERDQFITDQQVESGSLNTFSDSDRNSSKGAESTRESLIEESNESHKMGQGDAAFRTPCFKPVPNAFVVKRSHYSRQPEYSPLPDAFSDTADEDTWLKMNKGFITDLDSLHMTPARKVQSFPPCDESPAGLSIDNYKQEVENLQRQLKIATEERDKLERHQTEQILLNNRLMEELSELQQEAQLIREIPQRLCESVENCKEIYKDVLSIFQSFVGDDDKCSTAKVLSCTREIGTCLFSTLETHFSMAGDGCRTSTINNFPIQEQCNALCQKLINTITSLELAEAPSFKDPNTGIPSHNFKNKGYTLGGAIACWKEKLGDEVNSIKEKYESLEKTLDTNKQLLEVSKERYHCLEKEFNILLLEKDSLIKSVSNSSQRLAVVTEQKEKVLLDLNNEIRSRKVLEEEIKQFSVAFACRQRSLASFHSEFKSQIEKLKTQKPVTIAKSLGY